MFFCVYLVQLGLNDIVHFYAKSCIFNKSLLSVEAVVFPYFTAESKKESQEMRLESDFNSAGKLFVEIRKK